MSFASRRRLALVIAVALMLAMTLPSTGLAALGGTDNGVGAAGVRAAAVYAPDVYENDDTTVTAVAVPATSYHTLESSATLANATDDLADWMKFTVTVTGTPVAVELNDADPRGCDPEFEIYPGVDNAGNLASTTPVFASDNAWYDDAAVFATMPAGVYYVKAWSNSGAGAYWAHITLGDARRVFGSDRYATCVQTTSERRPGDAGNVAAIILASGQNYADALAAGAWVGMSTRVLELTQQSVLTPSTKAEIERLSANTGTMTVYIAGGTAAVSTAVENTVKSMPDVDRVVRLAGTNRFGTAVALADEESKTVGINPARVVLVNGLNFADALAAAPMAGQVNAPILMASPTTLPVETKTWLASHNATDIIVCGGSSAIATSVLDAIQASVAGTQTFTRLAGTDRYWTSYEIAKYAISKGAEGSTTVLVSGGTNNWPDGLSAVNISRKVNGWIAPVLLSNPTTLSPSVVQWYKDNDGFQAAGAGYFPAYVVGGPVALSVSTYNAFRDLWKTPIN